MSEPPGDQPVSTEYVTFYDATTEIRQRLADPERVAAILAEIEEDGRPYAALPPLVRRPSC